MRFTTFFILENPLSHLGEAIRLFWHHVPLVNPGSFHFVLCLTRKNNLVILSPLVILPCVEIQKKVEGDHIHFHMGHVDKHIYRKHEYICICAYECCVLHIHMDNTYTYT